MGEVEKGVEPGEVAERGIRVEQERRIEWVSGWRAGACCGGLCMAVV